MSTTRKVIVIVIVAFIVYAIFTRPNDAADGFEWAGNLAKDAADSVTTFFDELLS